MRIQLLIGPNEFDREYEIALGKALMVRGFSVDTVAVDRYLETHSVQPLENDLSGDVFASIIFSGIRWDRFVERIDPTLLPNSIVITSNPALQFAWEIRPVVVIPWDKTVVNRVIQALESFSSEDRIYPARGVSFHSTNFGWKRKLIMEEFVPLQAWSSLCEHIWPKYKFLTWSVKKGYLGNTITIEEIRDSSIVVRSPTVKKLQIVPKKDFLSLALVWSAYKKGRILRYQLKDMTRYSTYIIALLLWLDLESHLLNDE